MCSMPAACRPLWRKSPVSEEQISPELGRDTIRASAQAMIVSTLAVLVFMLFYYRFAGIVADLGRVVQPDAGVGVDDSASKAAVHARPAWRAWCSASAWRSTPTC